MWFLVLIPMICLFSCGQPPAFQDAALAPYAQDFANQYNVDLSNITIKFGDMAEPGSVGQCLYIANTVTVLKSYWDTSSEITKGDLMSHELGHCARRRQHVSELYEDGCPKSVMNPVLLSDYCYLQHKQELIQEMF